jgi:hypothetical protein
MRRPSAEAAPIYQTQAEIGLGPRIILRRHE